MLHSDFFWLEPKSGSMPVQETNASYAQHAQYGVGWAFSK